MCRTFRTNCSKSRQKFRHKCFFKLLKVAENLRVEFTGRCDRCVPRESRNMWKQVPWILAKRAVSYACSKVSFSKNCCSAPIWPIAVRLVSVLFGMLLYLTVKCHKQITLHVCIRGRRRKVTNQQFSSAHKKFIFTKMKKSLEIFVCIGPKFTCESLCAFCSKILGRDTF